MLKKAIDFCRPRYTYSEGKPIRKGTEAIQLAISLSCAIKISDK